MEIKIPEPLASVMAACEIYCVAGCCGLDAFDINPQWIRVWMEGQDATHLPVAKQQIEAVIAQVTQESGEHYIPVLNTFGTSAYWLPILTEWANAIDQAPDTPLPQPPPEETPVTPGKETANESLRLLGCGLLGAVPIVALIAVIRWLLGR